MDILFKEVADSVKSLFDLTSRVDERVKLLTDKIDEHDEKLNELCKLKYKVNTIESHESILQREVRKVNTALTNLTEKINVTLADVTDRIEAIEARTQTVDSRWKIVLDFLYKAIGAIAIGWLLYKLNLNAPTLP